MSRASLVAPQGWFDVTGRHTQSNLNYFVGSTGSSTHRNYFIFDFTSACFSTVTSAAISIANPSPVPDGTTAYTLYSYATSPTTPNQAITDLMADYVASSSPGQTIYTALAAGTAVGDTTAVAANPVAFNFNAAGLAFVNSALGG